MNGKRLTECPVCGSNNLRFKVRTFDRHYMQFHKKFDVFMCGSCKLIFLNPMIGEEELHDMYPKDTYYAYKEIEDQKPTRKNNLLIKIKRILINTDTRDPKFKNVKELSVVDIGCGSGHKLLEFKNDGWKSVLGIEIDKHSCEQGKAKGLTIINKTLTEANLESDSFDYVRSNHSFEHIISNREIMEEMHRICKPEGKIFIGVPNTRSLNYKIFGKYWYFFGIPFHPYSYNPKNLSLLMEQSGFKVEKIIYNGSALGFLGSFQIWMNSIFGIKHSKGIFINKFFEVIFNQFSRIINLIALGDCIEVIAVKEK